MPANAQWLCVESVPGELFRYQVLVGSETLSSMLVARLWREDGAFSWEFCRLLALCPFESFRWETPVQQGWADDPPFECVLLNAPDLAGRTPDRYSFAEYLGTEPVVTFANLGSDALLVVPSAMAPEQAYVDLASFSRGAPRQQQLALWRAVGQAVEARSARGPFWLNTAGGGVAWLHVRLDDRPKYYAHQPYRNPGVLD